MRGIWIPVALISLLAGCITIAQRPKERLPDTPDRIESETEPSLEPTQVEDVKKVIVGDVVDLYYVASRERYYRYAMNKWFIAFAWDGYWFPIDEGEFPEHSLNLPPRSARSAA